VTSEKPSAAPAATSIDDPDVIETTIREAAQRNTKALREQQVPIAVEPPTAYGVQTVRAFSGCGRAPR
jgi:hypothetical protein